MIDMLRARHLADPRVQSSGLVYDLNVPATLYKHDWGIR